MIGYLTIWVQEWKKVFRVLIKDEDFLNIEVHL